MFVFSNLAISLDGKIATRKRNFLSLGTQEDLKHMKKLRSQCDGILMGATTLREFRKPCLSMKEGPHPANIVMTSSLEKFSTNWEYFQDKNLERIFFIGSGTSKLKIKEFSKYSELIFLRKNSPKHPLADQIIDHLEKRGMKRLLIEGGGQIMWNFVSRNWIDEYHVTLTPKILGGSLSPTLVDGHGFSPHEILRLTLKSCRVIKNELYLVYKRRLHRELI